MKLLKVAITDTLELSTYELRWNGTDFFWEHLKNDCYTLSGLEVELEKQLARTDVICIRGTQYLYVTLGELRRLSGLLPETPLMIVIDRVIELLDA